MTFTLDSSVLDSSGGLAFTETFLEGRGRGIAVLWEQGDLGVDMELLGYSIRFWPADEQAMNPLE